MAKKPVPKPLGKKPKLSKAAQEAATRNKAAEQARKGKYQKAVKTQKAASTSRRLTTAERRVSVDRTMVPKLVAQPPRTPTMDKGVSLAKLMRSTPRMMHENAQDCYVTDLKQRVTKKGLPAVVGAVRHKDPFRPNKTVTIYECMFVGLDDPNKTIQKQKRVMASCNCGNYTFMWEYANAAHGAARIIYGNGEPPDFMNPSQAVGLCKHLVKLANVIKSEGL